MSDRKTYYFILGVSEDAEPARIRSAYRDLAKTCHPDRTGLESAQRFREISEAYEVLSDPAKRRSYDRELAGRRHGSSFGRHGWEEAEDVFRARTDDFGFRGGNPLEELFGSIFENLAGFGFGGPAEQTAELVLSADEAARGGRYVIRGSFETICDRCLGTARRGPFICARCRGQGRYLVERDLDLDLPPGLQHGHVLTLRLGGPGPGASLLQLRVIVRD